MTTEKKDTDHGVSENVLTMAKAIEKQLKLDTKTGIVESEDGIYEKMLPEELSIETVKAVGTHNANFIAAGSYAVGNIAVQAMAKHKSLDRVSGEIKMAGRDVMSVNVDREKPFTNHLKRDADGNPETGVKVGVVTTSYDVRAGRNSGELKKVRSAIADMAMAKLSK